jgi:hypothetical protein
MVDLSDKGRAASVQNRKPRRGNTGVFRGTTKLGGT